MDCQSIFGMSFRLPDTIPMHSLPDPPSSTFVWAVTITHANKYKLTLFFSYYSLASRKTENAESGETLFLWLLFVPITTFGRKVAINQF